eukprot:TRINITY_DN8516_c0_g1_i8.p1 TRINITY_DN8516_c0_g1~~TRINITY_DN8516_c0_g1_i8.p1  ORF type:complete len:257 (-),score=45.11 TRINITY_DN8516_c0_g1_i8:39-728(-)
MWILYLGVAGLLLLYPAPAASNLDERCSCKCPGIVDVFGANSSILVDLDFPSRKLYINSTVSAQDCDCEHVIRPVLSLDSAQMEKLCPRCKCTHQQRSTTTIKVVIIMILWVLSILAVYLLYLVCVDPMFRGKQIQVIRGGRGLNSSLPYQQQENDLNTGGDIIDNDVTATPLRSYQQRHSSSDGVAVGGSGAGASRGVVNRLGRETDRWKRQVEIQRSSVYDRHTMLN